MTLTGLEFLLLMSEPLLLPAEREEAPSKARPPEHIDNLGLDAGNEWRLSS